MTQSGDLHAPRRRDVVLGRSSRIWQALAQRPPLAQRFQHAIGHAELRQFAFTPADRVWVLAYSRHTQDNTAMLRHLQDAGVAEIVYITSSSTIIAPLTDCYEYPRAKHLAETQALAMPQGKVLTFGLVVEHLDELPAGRNAATTLDDIAQFMLNPVWPVDQGRRANLLRTVQRPFASTLERHCYQVYGWLMARLQRRPCLLRPLDLVLRTLGMRWYGYTYLSNQLWTNSTTS